MTDREVMRLLRMGCGESLRPILGSREDDQTVLHPRPDQGTVDEHSEKTEGGSDK